MTNSSPTVRRRAGRPARQVLSKRRITDAALELVQADGYERLTMSALAARLRVAPSALYNHAGAKSDVLRWVQDHVMTMVDVSAFGEKPWDEAVRRWAWSYRDVFARHTPLIPVIAVLPVTGAPETLKMYETVAAAFRTAGWAEGRIIPGIIALESFIFGSAFDSTAPGDIFDTGELAEAAPVFTAAVRAQRADVSSADAAFALGLDALLSGLAPSAHAHPHRSVR